MTKYLGFQYSIIYGTAVTRTEVTLCWRNQCETMQLSMSDIFRSTVLAKLLYCAPAWSGFCSAADRVRLETFLRRCQRLGYCSSTTPTLAEMFDEADESLFSRVLTNRNHVLQSHLPDRPSSQYNLRKSAHDNDLITKTKISQLNERYFIVRKLCKTVILLSCIMFIADYNFYVHIVTCRCI